MTLDYWADNIKEGKPATLGYLMSQLKNENLGYIKEKPRDGEIVLKYFNGKIVLRGRSPEGMAYKLTVMPNGLLKSAFARNNRTLMTIIESSGIKLTEVKE